MGLNLAFPRPFPLIATILTLIGIAVLCALGHWQQERLVWKNDLQAKLDAEFAKDATATSLSTDDLQAITDTSIRRGTITGKFDFKHQVILRGQIEDKKSVNYVLIPFMVDKTTPVFVVAGYQTDDSVVPEPATRASTDRVTGTARLPHWNKFTTANVPEKNMWYRADVKQMTQTQGLAEPLATLFYLESSNYKMDAMPHVDVPRDLRNDHEQYMYFWYTMAAILAVIYVLRFWRRGDILAD